MGNKYSYKLVNNIDYDETVSKLITECVTKLVGLHIPSKDHLILYYKDNLLIINYRRFCLGEKNRFETIQIEDNILKIFKDEFDFSINKDITNSQCNKIITRIENDLNEYDDYQSRLVCFYNYILKIIDWCENANYTIK